MTPTTWVSSLRRLGGNDPIFSLLNENRFRYCFRSGQRLVYLGLEASLKFFRQSRHMRLNQNILLVSAELSDFQVCLE